MESLKHMGAEIYYDGECPFCTRYVKLLRLKQSIGDVNLIDLRDDPALRKDLTDAGFDLDQGMVVEFEGQRLGGADATNALAMMSTPSNLFNQLNKTLFSAPAISTAIYPVLRSGRWLTLFLMGRKSIYETVDDMSWQQTLFSFFFGLFSLFHVFNYAFAYNRFPPQADLIAVFAIALVLLLRPQSARILFFLMLASLISTIAQAPAQSNHTMLRTMVIVGYWLSFSYTFIRGKPATEIFQNFVLAGRGGLLVMYAFGIFHKINTDFLNPETSCAVRLWQDMPFPLSAMQGPLIDAVTIYGTYAVEGTIMLLLIYRPTRYLGMVAGIFFHLLLGLSDYAAYIAFTTLSISLHALFLSSVQTQRILQSTEMEAIRTRIRQPVYLATFVALLIGGALTMYQGAWSLSNLYLLPFVLPLCYLIIRYGHEATDAKSLPRARAGYVIGALVTMLYFANGIAPYFGLKTAQSINMFSNLRLESGVSNHLVFSSPPATFDYLENVAVITDTGGSRFLRYYQNFEFGIVYYDLLAHLSENTDLQIGFELNGRTYRNVDASDFADDIATTLHHPFLRKWFHFLPVQFERPEACSL